MAWGEFGICGLKHLAGQRPFLYIFQGMYQVVVNRIWRFPKPMGPFFRESCVASPCFEPYPKILNPTPENLKHWTQIEVQIPEPKRKNENPIHATSGVFAIAREGIC